MNKLIVAVLVEENCLPTEGGGYSYYQTLVKEIDQYHFPNEIEIVYLLPGKASHGYSFSKPTMVAKFGWFDKIVLAILHKLYRFIHWMYKDESKLVLEWFTRIISNISNRNIVSALRDANVDLVYYLKPNDHPMDFPMIVTHWDVGHKSMYPFPEVSANGNFPKRENYYLNMLNKAFLILCESEAGAAELKYFYPINCNKIKVLPLFAGEVIQLTVSKGEEAKVLSRHSLVYKRYFLYPAQFWAHKNHFNLVVAFKKLQIKTENADLKLILCGADQGNMAYIKEVVTSLNLDRSVFFTGFIDNSTLNIFYRNAIALVMPTYLGPTNLPLIEAAMLKCAVTCSDLVGHREILGDTALYFDPADAVAISSCMEKLLDFQARQKMENAAFKQINQSAFHVNKTLVVLERILLGIKPVRKAWGMIPSALQLVACASIEIIN